MRLRIVNLALRYQNSLLASIFVVSVALAGFGAGAYVAEYRVFPYYLVREAASGVLAIYRDVTNITHNSLEMRVSEFSAVEAATQRIERPDALTSGLLWPGGEGLFREICPERGCLAVEFSSSGEVVHGYPYRLNELMGWDKIIELPRGTVHPFQAPELFKVPNATRKYSNDDLLVIYNYVNSVPWKGGVARIDREGMPVWVRDDYSHHWPTIFMGPDGEELALVPGSTIGHVPVRSRLRHSTSGIDIDCTVPNANVVDHVKLLDASGSALQDVRIIDKIIESPFASILFHSTDPCDVLHLNYIDRIRQDVQGIPGIDPGDYVVSLRNISSFGIMDSETGNIKRMVRGTFTFQHSVQHLKGSEFLLFDNHGADTDAGPSRVLLVDLADGGISERTVYPLADTPEEFRLYSRIRGSITISKDRDRFLIVSSNQGIALEVRLSDGVILNVLRNIHDLSGLKHNLEMADSRAVYLLLQDLQYIKRK